MNEHSFNNNTITLNVGKSLRKTTSKLSGTKRKQILEYLYKSWNITKAAQSVGVTRQAVEYHLKRNDQFRHAADLIKEMHTDNVEEVCLQVACLDTREGFNDRKLWLQAHRDIYGPKQEIKVTHVVDAGNAIAQLDNLLSKFSRKDRGINAIKADYKVEDT